MVRWVHVQFIITPPPSWQGHASLPPSPSSSASGRSCLPPWTSSLWKAGLGRPITFCYIFEWCSPHHKTSVNMSPFIQQLSAYQIKQDKLDLKPVLDVSCEVVMMVLISCSSLQQWSKWPQGWTCVARRCQPAAYNAPFPTPKQPSIIITQFPRVNGQFYGRWSCDNTLSKRSV